MGCGCRKRSNQLPTPTGSSSDLWTVQWPSGEMTAFAREEDARAYYDGHPAKELLHLVPPGEVVPV